jgi:hypothetical protein
VSLPSASLLFVPPGPNSLWFDDFIQRLIPNPVLDKRRYRRSGF